MSWMLNNGPSFNTTLPGSSYPQLSGFTQRFMLRQDDARMTPGKPEPHLPSETTKGTYKLKKPTRKAKRVRCKDLSGIPSKKNEPTYQPFAAQPTKRKRKRRR